VVFLDETGPISSQMKDTGMGELGICGVGAAVANAIYKATGARVREYPQQVRAPATRRLPNGKGPAR
jgi:xanthine dehydrogenase YagR molybdenum-binding subunit